MEIAEEDAAIAGKRRHAGVRDLGEPLQCADPAKTARLTPAWRFHESAPRSWRPRRSKEEHGDRA